MGRFYIELYMSSFIKEILSSLGICKSSCRPDDVDDDIFTFFWYLILLWIKGVSINVFKLAFSFLALHENLELLKTYTHRKTNLQHNHKIKCREWWYFGQTVKLKWREM